MIGAQRIRYELRRLGALGLAMPVLVALLFCGFALLSALMGAEKHQAVRMLVAGLELGLPLAVGVVAASVTADEPAIDLQLTVQKRYRHTLALRLVLLVGWTVPFALAWALALRLLGLWGLWVPEPFLVGQLRASANRRRAYPCMIGARSAKPLGKLLKLSEWKEAIRARHPKIHHRTHLGAIRRPTPR